MLHSRSKLIQLAFVYMLNDNPRFTRFRHNRGSQMFLRGFGNPYFIQGAAGTKRFKH
ncbi:hypothetical protein D3C80_2213640 [compost metagenome]